MTQTFRQALLAADDNQQPKLVKNKNGILVDDNLFHQMQKMFAYLELSDRQDFDPSDFCFTYKDSSGNPINVCVQQDALEFLNILFDKLESSFKLTPFKYILQSIFGGNTCSEMICSSCGHIKQRYELFYTLQLRIEGCNKLEDSLRKLTEGETISDFKCDACKQKCDQLRNTKFESLPNVLILQLQRIIFDYDTFLNKKINTRLEFPQLLNLKEFCTQKKTEQNDKEENSQQIEREKDISEQAIEEDQSIKPDENYNYKLKGITVHSGAAEVGHYYSYIKVKEDKWMEFNDSLIKEFDPRKIEQECFGGAYQSSDSDNFWDKGESSKNAYILVYEREQKSPLTVVTTTQEMKDQVERSLHLPVNEGTPNPLNPQELISSIDYYGITQCLTEKQFINLWLDNHKFMVEKHVFSLEFWRFFKEILALVQKPKDYSIQAADGKNEKQKLEKTPSKIYANYLSIESDKEQLYISCLEMCCSMFFDIFYKACDFEMMQMLGEQIKMILDLTPQHTHQFAKNFIFQRFEQLECVLTVCPELKVRSAFSQLTVHTINNLICYYSIKLTESDINEEENENNQIQRDILKLLDNLLDKMHTEVAKNWLRMEQYLNFWRDFAMGGKAQVQWCFKKQMIARLVDFFLGAQSPFTCYTTNRQEIGNRFVSSSFNPLLQTVAYLLKQVGIINIIEDGNAELSENDLIALNNIDLYLKAFNEKYEISYIQFISQQMQYNNKEFSEKYGIQVLKVLYSCPRDRLQHALDLLQSYLSVDDNLHSLRIEWIFGYPSLKINSTDGYETKPNLEEDVILYQTRLKDEGIQSLLHVLYHNKKTWDNLCLHLLHRVLLMCKNDSRYLNYLMELPAPNYSCAHYLSWVRSHLESVIQDASKSVMNQPKEELAKTCLAVYIDVEGIVNKYADEKQEKNKQVVDEDPKENVQNLISENEYLQQEEQKQMSQPEVKKGLRSLWKNYIIGKTVSFEETSMVHISDDEFENSVVMRCLDYTTLITDSHPTGTTNTILPDSIKQDCIILLSQIDRTSSNIDQFFDIPNFSYDAKATSDQVDFGEGKEEESKQQAIVNNELDDASAQRNNSNNADIQVSSGVMQVATTDLIGNLQENEEVDQADYDENNKNNPNSNEDSIDSNKAYIGEDCSSSNILSTTSLPIITKSFADDTTASSEMQNTNAAPVGGNIEEDNSQKLDQKLENDNQENNNNTNNENNITENASAAANENSAAIPLPYEGQPLQGLNVKLQLKSTSSNVIRRFVIDNNSQYAINILIRIVSQADCQKSPMNQHMPQEIRAEIPGNTSQSIFSMRKVDPSREWDEYAIQPHCIFIYPQQENQQPVEQKNAENSSDSNKQNPPPAFPLITLNVPEKDAATQGEYFSSLEEGGDKACPVCTFVQSASRQTCEICESQM